MAGKGKEKRLNDKDSLSGKLISRITSFAFAVLMVLSSFSVAFGQSQAVSSVENLEQSMSFYEEESPLQENAEEPLPHEHEWEIIEKIEATCTEDGEITYKCKVPECEEEKTEVIPMTGHSWNQWTVIKPATYISQGKKERTCAVCGTKETASIAKRKAYYKWVTVNNRKYYLNGKGNPVKGWNKIRISNRKTASRRWCYFNKYGVFRKSIRANTSRKWIRIGTKKFYFTSKKRPARSGFRLIRNKLYYIGSDRAIVTGTFKAKNGKTYTTRKDGSIGGIPFYKVKYRTFVLVDISDQELYYYKDKKRIMKTEVITGTKNKYNTPTGTYKIRSKRRNIYLIGPTWRKKVQYWMAFIGIEYGFHDVGWRDEKDFDDSTTYIKNGSFGCVNMRTDDVAELYSNIAKGTKVIIRK
ncbi:MAG TPA: L,D-transpeptidase [Mogibacterium sp.]|nr:L,D-transpeptidase [Mogibacterium sp.]